MKTPTFLMLIFLLLVLGNPQIQAQKVENSKIKQLIETYKSDPRGPYKDIRWFCKDGTTNPPKEPCTTPDGVQRARYKDEVVSLAKTNHVFLGQILSTTDKKEFWDAENFHSQLKQYQIEKFLKEADEGWVSRKARYYRGAVQAEDEEEWGKAFFKELLGKDEILTKHFYLVRQAAKDIPHSGDNDNTQKIRALSKAIADGYPAFMDLRIKIHGQPAQKDIELVRGFLANNSGKLSADQKKKMNELIAEMELAYRPVDFNSFKALSSQVSATSKVGQFVKGVLELLSQSTPGPDQIKTIVDLMWEIRENILTEKRSVGRLALLDISIKLEDILSKEITAWESRNVKESLEKIHYLSKAAAACGFLEQWEANELSSQLNLPESQSLTLGELTSFLDAGRRVVEWGTGMGRATYGPIYNMVGEFEPLAFGFLDDKIRSSLLLPLGQSVSELGDFISREASLSNLVMKVANQSHVRGLNPGYALGELVVVTGNEEDVEVSNEKIYLFQRPPSDLKPLAGIATVSEGNLVSHVQLLARNLGIPNAVISMQNLQDLKKYSGKKVFYAVSNGGTVIMKPEAEMSAEEKRLFEVKKRNEDRIWVPADKINLAWTSILDLRKVKSNDSGELCGPKAANLGQLKFMFPEKVVEGLVIPFGIFREHLDQQLPDKSDTYWGCLNHIFESASAMEEQKESPQAIEKYTLDELASFREAMAVIRLDPDFVKELSDKFTSVLGKPIGEVPVFLRSDTNMEDLKDFSGAGLNLTKFNVLSKEKILAGIKEVWASPYTERSYKWRQRYLLNPENVFPSILIIPSVDVDYSGVLITKGIVSHNDEDMTVAFSRGAGGAVDGQAAESYLLKANGEDMLLSPPREAFYNSLPATGGTQKKVTTFENSLLNARNIREIRQLAKEVREKMPEAPGVESTGPFDVELGFQNNKLWLFQIRPFVENKKAVSSTYLESITPVIPTNKKIDLSSAL